MLFETVQQKVVNHKESDYPHIWSEISKENSIRTTFTRGLSMLSNKDYKKTQTIIPKNEQSIIFDREKANITPTADPERSARGQGIRKFLKSSSMIIDDPFSIYKSRNAIIGKAGSSVGTHL